jgi:hypothetical protein
MFSVAALSTRRAPLRPLDTNKYKKSIPDSDWEADCEESPIKRHTAWPLRPPRSSRAPRLARSPATSRAFKPHSRTHLVTFAQSPKGRQIKASFPHTGLITPTRTPRRGRLPSLFEDDSCLSSGKTPSSPSPVPRSSLTASCTRRTVPGAPLTPESESSSRQLTKPRNSKGNRSSQPTHRSDCAPSLGFITPGSPPSPSLFQRLSTPESPSPHSRFLLFHHDIVDFPGVCRGRTKKGVQCQRSSPTGYCHSHKRQDPSPVSWSEPDLTDSEFDPQTDLEPSFVRLEYYKRYYRADIHLPRCKPEYQTPPDDFPLGGGEEWFSGKPLYAYRRKWGRNSIF